MRCTRIGSKSGHSGPKIAVRTVSSPTEEIRRFELQGLPGDSAKSLIWRYVFAVHAGEPFTETLGAALRESSPRMWG